MSIHETVPHRGTTELTFATSLGTPVEGLRYRLSDDQGHAWAGSTGKGGKGVTITEAASDESSSLPAVWNLPGDAHIQLEVQRDDGSWKTVGSFRHSAGSHKQVNVIAGTIAVPFQMSPA